MSKMSRQEAEEIVESARFTFPGIHDAHQTEAWSDEVLVRCFMEYGTEPTAEQIQTVVFREADKREALEREANEAEFKAQLARAIGMNQQR